MMNKKVHSGDSTFDKTTRNQTGLPAVKGMQDYPKHYCGVFGVFGHPNAAEISYYGLYALQHRGHGRDVEVHIVRNTRFLPRSDDQKRQKHRSNA